MRPLAPGDCRLVGDPHLLLILHRSILLLSGLRDRWPEAKHWTNVQPAGSLLKIHLQWTQQAIGLGVSLKLKEIEISSPKRHLILGCSLQMSIDTIFEAVQDGGGSVKAISGLLSQVQLLSTEKT